MREISGGLECLEAVVEAIVEILPDSGVVILQGDLAAGKTTLTQAFARFLKLEDSVTSPTFSLQQCYGERLFHYDIYNHGLEHFLSLGMFEELEKEGYHLIEWGDEALATLLKSALIETAIVKITKTEGDKRLYRIEHA